jgi:hypothetical protein
MSVTKERGKYQEIMRNLKRLDGSSVDVGFFPESVYEGEGITVAGVAAVQEFGSIRKNIPERPFFRRTLQKNKVTYKLEIKELALDVLIGRYSATQAWSRFGAMVEGDLKKEITTLRQPPNAPATIRAKGSSNPLIDSGHMRRNVKHKARSG